MAGGISHFFRWLWSDRWRSLLVLFLLLSVFAAFAGSEISQRIRRHVLRISDVSAIAIPSLHADEWGEPYKIIPIDFDNDGDTEQLVGFNKIIRVIDFRANPPREIRRAHV